MNLRVTALQREKWTAPLRRAAAGLEWVVLTVLAALFVWKGLVPAWQRLNTDFPNYYLSARLYRDGYPLERLYDWIWFQRQKDHAGLDQPIIGYGVLTPFSALAMTAFVALPALAAKRCWLGINLLLLGVTIFLLRAMTRLPARRVAIVAFLAVIPLRTCFLYGQQHLLILCLLTLAMWLELRGRSFSSGALLAVAAVLKIYPALFGVFFLLKGRWRALTGLCLTLAALVGLGTALVGFDALRVYATNVLPRALASEGTDPYFIGTNTLTPILRRLFVADSEVNPHPFVHSPATFSLLQSWIQALLLVSGLFFVATRRPDRSREKLEWGAFVALLLVLSTNAATYHFCALILATVLGVDFLLGRGQCASAAALVSLYAFYCFPIDRYLPAPPSGAELLLGVPRLYALFGYWGVFLWTCARVAVKPHRRRWERIGFVLAFIAMAVSGTLKNFRHLRAQFQNSAVRLPIAHDSLIATAPAFGPEGVYFSRTSAEGYVLDRTGEALATRAAPGTDFFHPSVALGLQEGWVEVSSERSRIARFPLATQVIQASELPVEVEDGEQPAVSSDGRWLGFMREERGRGSLWVRSAKPDGKSPNDERELVAASREVLDFAFFPDDRIVLAARKGAGTGLFVTTPAGEPLVELATSDRPARYPAVSADARWLAYSVEDRGAWQLQVMDLATGEQRRLTHGECNSSAPAWAPDGTHIVYVTDCNRGVGFTALYVLDFRP